MNTSLRVESGMGAKSWLELGRYTLSAAAVQTE